MFTLLSCYNEWIFRPEIKGVVLDKNSNKSLISIVKTLAIEGESPDSTISNNKGVFILPKKSSDGWTFLGMEKPKGPPTTNKIIIMLMLHLTILMQNITVLECLLNMFQVWEMLYQFLIIQKQII